MSTYTILHATDLHPDGGIAFTHSVAMARASAAKLVTVHARTPDGATRRPMPDAVALLAEWGAAPQLDFTTMEHECCDDPVDTLLDAVRRVQPDLLVVGTHQKTGLEQLLSDSVSNSLAANAVLPTLVLPIGKRGFVSDEGQLAIRRILIPAGSHDALTAALRVATELVERLGVQELDVHIMHAGTPGLLESELVPEHAGWTYHFEDVPGDLRTAMKERPAALGVDLVVMATRGQDGILDVFRGTHAQQTMRTTSCPLLIVPM